MTDSKRPSDDPSSQAKRVPLDLTDGGTVKVRCGRATVTFLVSNGVLMGPVGESLVSYRDGAASADDVARYFLEDRTVDHSLTFDWEKVDLLKLLPLVTAVSSRPKFEAKTPDELVTELEEVEKREREMWEPAARKVKEMLPALTQRLYGDMDVNLDLSRRLLGQVQSPELKQAMDRFWSSQHFQAPNLEALSRQLAISLRPPSPLPSPAAPALSLRGFGIDPRAYEEIIGLGHSLDLGNHLFANMAPLESSEKWQTLIRDLAEAARGADSPDIADAVESSAQEAEKDATEIDVEGLFDLLGQLLTEQREGREALEDLSAEQKKANEKLDEVAATNSASRQFLLNIGIQILWTAILVILATKLGIYLPPPPP